MKIEQNQPLPLQPGPDAPVAPAADQPDPAYVAKATKAAVEFERFFISNMLKEMRSSTRAMAAEDSVFNNRVNQDMQDMADDLLAGNMAGNRAFGIADAILRQLVPGAKHGK
ncbi:rod-binding protein [Massilia agri]|uniref:Rod-binding protein n=1 Tax=Massilia agri TaxID=1886785 RepID=A0ABT2AMT6_9BURK|nr:rod-binding protein [Massilia agri]MCS0597048.1 rod-binding protein [Massilia agri]